MGYAPDFIPAGIGPYLGVIKQNGEHDLIECAIIS